jgi:hypothetical protein
MASPVNSTARASEGCEVIDREFGSDSASVDDQ